MTAPDFLEHRDAHGTHRFYGPRYFARGLAALVAITGISVGQHAAAHSFSVTKMRARDAQQLYDCLNNALRDLKRRPPTLPPVSPGDAPNALAALRLYLGATGWNP